MENITELQELGKILLLAIALLIVWFVLKKTGGKKKGRSFRSPSLRHLRNQFLRGDITKEEYEKQKKNFEEKEKE